MVTMDTTVVHLMRHGEVLNAEGVLYGRLPGFGLSQLGARMAECVAAHLGDHDIVHVVSSPLQRALETTAPIARRVGVEVLRDARTIEATNWFQGQQVGGGAAHLLTRPGAWRQLTNPFRPSWGEPYEQIAERMLAAVTDARNAARGREAVIVSHQLPIWEARCKLEGRRLWHNPRRRRCALASVTSLHFIDDDLDVIAYAEPARGLLAKAATQAGA